MKINRFDCGNKVFKFLQNAKPGSRYIIDNICKEETKQLFIEFVKEYMDMTPWQGGWEFSNDYKILKRQEIPEIKKNGKNNAIKENNNLHKMRRQTQTKTGNKKRTQ
jgi:hypothetical protein